MSRQITLSAPGSGYSGVFVADRSDDLSNAIVRSMVGGYRNLGRTDRGKIQTGRSLYRPKFEYALTGLANADNAAALSYFLALMQTNPNQQFVLLDEWERIDALELAWNNRLLLSGSTITIAGRNRSFFSTNVKLFLLGDAPGVRQDAGGFHRYTFGASEV